ncbi:MAG: hypothetical protein M1840_007874 [Geoglossum simile]|nr:MAG: hypothetical protein M1840_007874 [Geoglossum simile]
MSLEHAPTAPLITSPEHAPSTPPITSPEHAPATPPRLSSSLPDNISTGPTPSRSAVSTLQSSSFTIASMQDLMLRDFRDRQRYDIDGFFDTFLLPDNSVLFDSMVTHVLEQSAQLTMWQQPRSAMATQKDAQVWFAPCLTQMAKLGIGFLESEIGLEGLTIGDRIDDELYVQPCSTAEMWLSLLRQRSWRWVGDQLPGDGRGRGRADLVLTASASTRPGWWNTAVIGEHKSDRAGDGERHALTAQVARYVSEVFAAQDFRHFVHAFSIRRRRIRLYLFDRCGVMGSTELDIDVAGSGGRRQFVRAMLAYMVMEQTRFGFDPEVFADPVRKNRPLLAAEVDPETGEWRATEGRDIAPTFFVCIDSHWFQLVRRIVTRLGIVCRGTRCYIAVPVADQDGQKHEEPGECLVKLSWRWLRMRPEGAWLAEVHAGTPVPNLVSLIAHDERQQVGREIRRRMACVAPVQGEGPGTEEDWDRVFTRTVLREVGHRLERVKNALSLCQVIRDVVVAHSILYFQKRCTHRDISTGNILIQHTNNTTSGLLIDLDFARHNSSQAPRSGAPNKTGTLPFMAISILERDDTEHRYRHDIESFFYVLLWTCIYDENVVAKASMPISNPHTVRDQLRCEDIRDPLLYWRKGLPENVAASKRRIIEMDERFESLLMLRRTGFEGEVMGRVLRRLREGVFMEVVDGCLEGRLAVLYSVMREREIRRENEREGELRDFIVEVLEQAVKEMDKECSVDAAQ